MEPPIPDPSSKPKSPIVLEKGPKPRALISFIGIALLSNFVWLVTPRETTDELPDTVYLLLFTLIMCNYWVLWTGKNWARIIMMVICAMSAVLVLGIYGEETYYSRFEQIHLILDGIFYSIWFWWLRSPAVVAFFKGRAA